MRRLTDFDSKRKQIAVLWRPKGPTLFIHFALDTVDRANLLRCDEYHLVAGRCLLNSVLVTSFNSPRSSLNADVIVLRKSGRNYAQKSLHNSLWKVNWEGLSVCRLKSVTCSRP